MTKHRKCRKDVPLVLLGIGLLISIATYSLAAETKNADSGVVGIVPHYADDLARTEVGLASVKDELAHATDACAIWQLDNAVARSQAKIDNARDRCVEAFDADSELPEIVAGASWPNQTCDDPWEFPRRFSKLLATGRCSDDGSFRLALPPGHYAIFVGWLLIGHSFSTNPWWQFVEVKPHQWTQLVPPAVLHARQSCQMDWDCTDGMICTSRPGANHKTCEERPKPFPPWYDSGVSGVIGAVANNYQCVEIFREPSDLMAACAQCLMPNGGFKVPLAPGRYRLEFRGFWNPTHRRSIEVEVPPHQWKRITGSIPDIPPDSPCTAKQGYIRAH